MFTSEAAIPILVDHCVDVVISKALFLLLIYHNLGVPVRIVFLCCRGEGCRVVA